MNSSNDNSPICMREWLVTGKVQGVAYRAFTRHHANKLGVHGFARNLADGRVQVVACGNTDLLDHLLEQLQMGPHAARVESVELINSSSDVTEATEHNGFSIR